MALPFRNGPQLVSSVTTVFSEIGRNNDQWVRSQFAGDAQVEVRMEGDLGSELQDLIAKVDGVQAVASHAMNLYGFLQDFDFSKADPKWLAEMAERPVYPGRDPKAYLEIVPVDLAAMGRVYDFGRVQGSLDGGGSLDRSGSLDGGSVTLSEKQARDRGIRLGDTLTLDLRPDQTAVFRGRISPGPSTYKVTAIVEHLPFYPHMALVDRRLFPSEPTTRVFFSYDPARRAQVKAGVLALLRQPRYGMATLRDLHEAMEESRQMMNQRWAILGAVVGVILMVGAVGLVNSVITGLHERRREMATLRAVGSTPAQTARQVVLEAVVLGLAGSLLGLLAGAAFTGGVTVALGLPASMQFPIWSYLACLAAGPGLAALASILPAIRVSRGPVAQVLQTE